MYLNKWKFYFLLWSDLETFHAIWVIEHKSITARIFGDDQLSKNKTKQNKKTKRFSRQNAITWNIFIPLPLVLLERQISFEVDWIPPKNSTNIQWYRSYRLWSTIYKSNTGFVAWWLPHMCGDRLVTNLTSLEKSCPLQIMEIIATSNKFPWYFQRFGHPMVWKFVGSQLPTFWTLPWYGNLLEVNFQPFGHFHGMEICWKSTSNHLDTSMVWKFVGSQLPTIWTLPWYGNLLEVNFQPFGHFHGMEIFGKFVGSRNFHDLEKTWFFQCMRMQVILDSLSSATSACRSAQQRQY